MQIGPAVGAGGSVLPGMWARLALVATAFPNADKEPVRVSEQDLVCADDAAPHLEGLP